METQNKLQHVNTVICVTACALAWVSAHRWTDDRCFTCTPALVLRDGGRFFAHGAGESAIASGPNAHGLHESAIGGAKIEDASCDSAVDSGPKRGLPARERDSQGKS